MCFPPPAVCAPGKHFARYAKDERASPVGRRPFIGRWPASSHPEKSGRPNRAPRAQTGRAAPAKQFCCSHAFLPCTDFWYTYQYMRRKGQYVYVYIQLRRPQKSSGACWWYQGETANASFFEFQKIPSYMLILVYNCDKIIIVI